MSTSPTPDSATDSATDSVTDATSTDRTTDRATNGATRDVTPTIEVRDLSVSYRQKGGYLDAVRDVSLTIMPGQTYGLVGESGSGKSTLALALMRYLAKNGEVRSGSISLGGDDLLAMSDRQLSEVWQKRVKLVPQNPLPSLNPSQRVGKQVQEGLVRGGKQEVLDLFESVGLADPLRVYTSYPHELSGGMQQRVMIALALGGEPELLVLDEPTTNLDVTTEATILDLISELIAERNTAVLYVSHSLGVVSKVCDRVAVLYAGELVEDAAVDELYDKPLHPYTQGLLDSVPRIGQDKSQVSLRPIPGQIPDLGDLPSGCVFTPRCPVAIDKCSEVHPGFYETGGRRSRCHRSNEIDEGGLEPRQPTDAAQTRAVRDVEQVLTLRDVEKNFAVGRSLFDTLRGKPVRQVHAVDGIDLTLHRGRTLGLVGESGSGKSTLARCVIGLYEASSGEMELLDMPLRRALDERDTEVLKHLQMVFQSSDEALNPYIRVGDALRRPFMRLAGLSRDDADERVAELLASVKLSAQYAARLPGELSGGEKQRVAIARAFASQPDVLLFDEAVSGLDVSVQAAILNLLGTLQEERDTAYLFISHDLSVVSYLADEVAVVYLGHLMEVGKTRQVLEPPYHPYTEALLSAIPLIDPNAKQQQIRLEGDVPSPLDIPSGCRFHTRCPRFIGDICVDKEPPWQEDEDGHRIYCHIPLGELKETQQRVFTFARPDTETQTQLNKQPDEEGVRG
ncbi:MAG: ABC transporter ATP-binding protein [Trueperaceae bacterium]|nr:ABC transporter ATP-binding protein [Trueperaceae bacterium]